MKRFIVVIFMIFLLFPLIANAFETDEGLYDWFIDQEFSWYDGNNIPIDIEIIAIDPEKLTGLVVVRMCYTIDHGLMICDSIGQSFSFMVKDGNIYTSGLAITVKHNGDLVILDKTYTPIYRYTEEETNGD